MHDPDKIFGLAEGNIPQSVGKSAVVIKADQTRIIGREGVKIMSGQDSKNSLGRPIKSIPHINLIAGDADSTMMQPIPKGEKTLNAINAIVARLNQISGILDTFLQFQSKFNSVLMTHTHPSPTSMAIGTLAAGNPVAFCNGSTCVSYDCAVAGYDAVVSALLTKKDLMLFKGALAGTELQFTAPFSPDKILSKHVFTS